MKGPGILETVGLAGSLVFAIPVALFGLDSLLAGRTLFGGAFLVVAVLMVVLPRYLWSPTDVPAAMAERAASRIVKDEEE